MPALLTLLPLRRLDYDNMDEKKLRKIIQDEITKSQKKVRFGVQNSPLHYHDGVDSPRIKAENIVPAASISGSITMSQVARYTLNLNSSFTPRNILCTGNVTGGSQRYMFIGTAQLGPSFFFQPGTDTTVVTGGPQYPFIDPNQPSYGANIPMQSSVYYGQESAGGALHTLVGNFHIIDIQFPVGTSHARATVVDFSKDAITIEVETLDSGWDINANFVVT